MARVLVSDCGVTVDVTLPVDLPAGVLVSLAQRLAAVHAELVAHGYTSSEPPVDAAQEPVKISPPDAHAPSVEEPEPAQVTAPAQDPAAAAAPPQAQPADGSEAAPAAAGGPATAAGGDAPAPPGHARNTCPDCGQVFSRRDSLLEHQQRLHAADVEPLQRQCVGCGEPFVAKRKDSRYCTAACRHRATSRASYRAKTAGAPVRATIPAKPCDHCGEEFQPDRATGRFCSDGCRRAFFRKGGTPVRAAKPPKPAPSPKPATKPTAWRCGTCTQQFNSREDLARHQLTHAPARAKDVPAVVDLEPTRPFACDWCDRRFRLGHELAHHVKVQHTATERAVPADGDRPAVTIPVRGDTPVAEIEQRLARALAVAEGRTA